MSSYWERRQAEDMLRHVQGAEECADEIAKVYKKASWYLRQQAQDIFDRFRSKHGLSETEARQLLDVMYDRTSLDELLRKLEGSKSSNERQELRKQLEAPAYQARLRRLAGLQDQIDHVMQDVYGQERRISTGFYERLVREAYYRSVFNLQQRTGLGYSFSHVSPRQVSRMLNSRWSGKNYSARIWGNTQQLAQTLKEELLINLITGRTQRDTSQMIMDKFGQSAFNARRLVRTESNFLSSEMNFKAYEDAGVDKYLYLATLDLRTSQICRELDGKIFKVKDRKTGKNSPPMHPWCRSTTIAVIDEELLKNLKRSAVDPVTGKRIQVPLTMDYKQWYDKYVKERPAAELAEKKIKNASADRKQHEQYRKIFGDDIPEKLDDFQNLKYNESEKWESLKARKQDAINSLDIESAKRLNGKLSDREVRLWYKTHDEKIPELLDRSKSIEEQARQAHELRNAYRTQARDMMKDQEKRRGLDADSPNKGFEELLLDKMGRKGMTRDEAIRDILKTATKTNEKVNKELGLED